MRRRLGARAQDRRPGMRPGRQRLWQVGACAVVLFVLACRPEAGTPRGSAERFLDAHYVHMDLVAAKRFCAGLALRKVEDEIRLTRGQTVDEQTRKPQVRYRLLEERPRGKKRRYFVYEATATVPGATAQLKSRWLLALRDTEEGWKVWNYTEFY